MTDYNKEPVFVTRPLLPDLNKVSDRLNTVWESKWLTNNGAMHKELESNLKEYLKVNHLVLFNNGTLALMLGLKALELKGEVITTPFTFPATVQSLDWCGLTPVFCDIDRNNLNIDANKIEALITEHTSAILAVHVFGNPCDVYKIEELAVKYNLKIIYDGAHAFGAHIDGVPIGHFGDVTMFSFHATKLFNTVEGGGLTFREPSLEKRLNLLKNFGLNGPEEVILSGLNAKLNEVQAAIGIEVLKEVQGERERRKNIKRAYENGLSNIEGIRILTTLDDESSSYQYFTIEVNENQYGRTRDELHSFMEMHQVFTRKYFYPLCSDFEWYSHLESVKKENLPQAHKTVNQVLSLPYYGELSVDSVDMICNLIRDFKGELQ